MSGIESWQMCPKCHECSHSGSREEMNKVYSCPSYTTSVKLSNVCTMRETSEPNFVYTRRKQQKNTSSSAIFSAETSAGTKKVREDCTSVVSSCAPSVKEQHKTCDGEHAVEDKGESHVLRSESINGSLLVEERMSDQISKSIGLKVTEVDSINDSCSSSKSEMELASASMNTEAEDTSQCSSSDAMVLEVLGEELSTKDFHVSMTRSRGMLGEVWHSRTNGSSEVAGDSIASSSSWFCKICAHLESPHKMLICDNCEEAFHLSCCNPRVKRIPEDEWFCHSCSKKRCKILTATLSQRYPHMISEKGRCGNTSTSELNPIALMLRDTGPYSTGVRIGKGFQAEVPHWSGSITNDVNTIGEALEMDPTDFVTSTEFKSCKPHKFSSIGNWLQCKEVIDGAGESASGTICGKWRRAPLFEVQTDDWACFCCVLWDPVHADCSVPQELGTDQVLKQLKYFQMLRPQLIAKRRKLDCLKNDDGSVDDVEDLVNRRTRK